MLGGVFVGDWHNIFRVAAWLSFITFDILSHHNLALLYACHRPDFRSPGGMYDTLRPELIVSASMTFALIDV